MVKVDSTQIHPVKLCMTPSFTADAIEYINSHPKEFSCRVVQIHPDTIKLFKFMKGDPANMLSLLWESRPERRLITYNIFEHRHTVPDSHKKSEYPTLFKILETHSSFGKYLAFSFPFPFMYTWHHRGLNFYGANEKSKYTDTASYLLFSNSSLRLKRSMKNVMSGIVHNGGSYNYGGSYPPPPWQIMCTSSSYNPAVTSAEALPYSLVQGCQTTFDSAFNDHRWVALYSSHAFKELARQCLATKEAEQLSTAEKSVIDRYILNSTRTYSTEDEYYGFGHQIVTALLFYLAEFVKDDWFKSTALKEHLISNRTAFKFDMRDPSFSYPFPSISDQLKQIRSYSS
jgi:hypothetical protein